MWEKYKETFDGVHASQRLKTEVMNMKREENMTKKRRIPAAVLVVAVLAIALAGTALAAEYWGRVEVEPLPEDYPWRSSEVGNFVHADMEPVPVDSLSEDMLALTLEDSDTNVVERTFASWSDCEEFTGLEVADNPYLDQLFEEQPDVSLTVGFDWEQMPSSIRLSACYNRKDSAFKGMVSANLYTDHCNLPESQKGTFIVTNADKADNHETALEEYVTPSGMTATICYRSEVGTAEAYFTMNNALFTVRIWRGENWEAALEEGQDFSVLAMNTLKEILDAYE